MHAQPSRLSFPDQVDGGLKGLAAWLESQGTSFVGGVADSIDYDKRTKLALVVHNPHSGMDALQTHVYGCDSSTCHRMFSSLIPIRMDDRKGQRVVRLVVSKDRRTISVRTGDGVVHSQVLVERPGG